MKHIFYFVAIIFIIHELLWIISPFDKTKQAKDFKESAKANKGKKWDEYSDEYKGFLITKGIPAFIFLFWAICGLFTFNWPVFAAFILLNFFIIRPISRLFKYSIAYTILHWINSVIGFCFGVFIILNSYHFKVDFWEVLKSFFNTL